ncbi:unnamed protein product [Amoebophrya sp. A120]|nr:unnamed protein product [Amoebophrya sp. A120]|eukprot:GSA120T00002438001.1
MEGDSPAVGGGAESSQSPDKISRGKTRVMSGKQRHPTDPTKKEEAASKVEDSMFLTPGGINEVFKNPAHRRDQSLLDRLVEALKKMVVERFRSLEQAFYQFAEKGFLTQAHLDKMVKAVKIQVDGRVVRAIHDRMVNPDTKVVGFLEFQTVMMDMTLRKLKGQLQTYTRNHRRVRAKITAFVRSLVFQNTETMSAAVTRFQSKLTLNFAARLWNSIRRKISDSNNLSMSQFLGHIRSWKQFFHEYEYEFFGEIFKRLDRQQSNSVDVFHMMLALVFLSPETNKKVRFETVFRVFDTDDDGCLTTDQILKLYQTIRTLIPVLANDEVTAAANTFFNDELGTQEGRRLFDFTMDLYKSTSSNLLTWDELWSLFDYSTYLKDNLIPGLHQLNWVLSEDVVSNKQKAKGDGGGAEAKTDMKQQLARSQSEAHLWSAGVKQGYCAALRGEWKYVPRTLAQIDSQEYLFWNPGTGRDNRGTSGIALGKPGSALAALAVGSKGAASSTSRQEESTTPEADAEGEPATKQKFQKLRQSVSDTMFDQTASVPKVHSKAWGREAMLRFHLYSLAKAKKKQGEGELREDIGADKSALDKALASAF